MNENDTTLIYDLAAALNTEGVQQGIANDERMKAAVARRITQEKMDAYIAIRVQAYGPDVFSKVSCTGTIVSMTRTSGTNQALRGRVSLTQRERIITSKVQRLSSLKPIRTYRNQKLSHGRRMLNKH